ncbi:MAG: hypothetical protein ACKVP3_27060 [Hyphomicrobiaceae bacterium]
MTPSAQALVAEFDAAAKAAQYAEAELRKTLTEELARAERQRAFAFRRTRLIRVLASAAGAAETEDAAIAAQARSLHEELGWNGASAAQAEILEQMQPLGRAVWQCGCGMDGGTSTTVAAELQAFEQWFHDARGKPLYSLFDQYVPEVPVVDF